MRGSMTSKSHNPIDLLRRAAQSLRAAVSAMPAVKTKGRCSFSSDRPRKAVVISSDAFSMSSADFKNVVESMRIFPTGLEESSGRSWYL